MIRNNITLPEIRDAIAQHLKQGDPRIARVARELGLSTRTLQRKLASEQLTFSLLIQQVRMTRACRLLIWTRLPITKIAYQTGYTKLSSFSRAFHGWTGASPREFRHRTDLAHYDKFSLRDNGII